MARDRDWKEKRAREDEKEQEFKRSKTDLGASGTPSQPTHEDILTLLDRAVPLIEQCNTLYNQYFAGAEKRPPLEQRARLDALIEQLNRAHKSTPAQQFRYRSILSQYQTYRERWERLLK